MDTPHDPARTNAAVLTERTRQLLGAVCAQLRAAGPLDTAFLRTHAISLSELPEVLRAAADLLEGALRLPAPCLPVLLALGQNPELTDDAALDPALAKALGQSNQ